MKDNWQQELQHSITNINDLLTALEIDRNSFPFICEIKNFPLRVPRPYLARMCKGDITDPLLRQILPIADEKSLFSGYSLDPVNDLGTHQKNGILHKYHGRVLLIVTGACAIHCRYCFRRHFPYKEHILGRKLDESLSYIRDNSSIEEVILSGGDPLSLSNTRLFEICQHIENITHVQRIRIHTRLPIVIPSRLNNKFCDWLNHRPKPYIIVFHINHPAEIDLDVEQAVSRLTAVTRLNQAVLLKGVNDNVQALTELCQKCFATGILPYYLHLLDRVQGATHFEVNEIRAKELMQEVTELLPGYLVPRLVRDSGGLSKETLL